MELLLPVANENLLALGRSDRTSGKICVFTIFGFTIYRLVILRWVVFCGVNACGANGKDVDDVVGIVVEDVNGVCKEIYVGKDADGIFACVHLPDGCEAIFAMGGGSSCDRESFLTEDFACEWIGIGGAFWYEYVIKAT